MKRILALFLVFMLMFSMAACGNTENKPGKDHTEPGETLTSSTEPSGKETMPEAATGEESDHTADASARDTDSSESKAVEDVLAKIRIQIEDRSYDAFLYNNEAGRYMTQQLPYTIRLNKGEIDYCGTCDLDFENQGFAGQEGHLKGELLYYNGWFVIFLNEKLPLGENGPRIPFGRLADPADADDMLQNAASSADVTITSSDNTSDSEENSDMKMMIGDTAVPVTWEQNESADALRRLVKEKPLTIQMSMYGGFEQVGPIGQSLPRNDVQTTTGAGDIVLYSGNQIVVFYGSNSWAYTRLGHIDLTQQEMSDLLSHGDVSITLE